MIQLIEYVSLICIDRIAIPLLSRIAIKSIYIDKFNFDEFRQDLIFSVKHLIDEKRHHVG